MKGVPLIISLSDVPPWTLAGASEDVLLLKAMQSRVERKDGYFLLCKDTVFQSMDTFTVRGIPNFPMCPEWYLGKINPLPVEAQFAFEILISRWNADKMGNSYHYLCLNKTDLGQAVEDLAENGDREFVTPHGYTSWEQTDTDVFNSLSEYRQSQSA